MLNSKTNTQSKNKMEKTFHWGEESQEDVQVAQRHMKSCATSLTGVSRDTNTN
jgi:hypothetical protein